MIKNHTSFRRYNNSSIAFFFQNLLYEPDLCEPHTSQTCPFTHGVLFSDLIIFLFLCHWCFHEWFPLSFSSYLAASSNPSVFPLNTTLSWPFSRAGWSRHQLSSHTKIGHRASQAVPTRQGQAGIGALMGGRSVGSEQDVLCVETQSLLQPFCEY